VPSAAPPLLLSHPTPLGVRVERLKQAFVARMGGPPEGVWAAPGRVNLIGEHTDYNDGFALPIAIEQCALVALRRRPDRLLRLSSAQAGNTELRLEEIAPGRDLGWAAYVAGAAWAALQGGALPDGGQSLGFDLLLDSDVPIGAGLSSSAALSCATLIALNELWGLARSRLELALLAQRAENEIAGVPCGLLDQLACLCAESAHALWIDFRARSAQPIALPLHAAELELLVIDTRCPHQLVDGAYRERRIACQAAALALGLGTLRDAPLAELERQRAALGPERTRRARHVITENARVLAAVSVLQDAALGPAPERLARLGPLLSASHASLRDDFAVSVPELDLAAASAERAGALGARLVGGGFGGSVLCLVRAGRATAAADSVRSAFLAQGWDEPVCFPASAGPGARRLT
jgi:galactokinase